MTAPAAIAAQLVDIIERGSTPVPFAGCWIWCGALNNRGYGAVNVNGTKKAHRVSWTAFRGPIPPKMNVLHRCDMPACVNPDHLFLGTQADNMADMITKKRDRKAAWENHSSHKHPELRQGERQGRSRLTNTDILAVRSAPIGCRLLVRQYNVTVTHICNIRSRKAWRHI